MKKLATLTDGRNLFDYFEINEDDEPTTMRIDANGDRRINAYWEDDILTDDLANMDIVYFNKDWDFLEYYLNEKDIHEIWDIRFEDDGTKYSSKEVVENLKNYLKGAKTMKKIECFGDITDICEHIPHLKEMSLEDFNTWFIEHKDIYKWGWFWNEEKKELFAPYLIMSAPEWDIIYIMKDKMSKDDDYPQAEIINFMYGQSFYNKEDGFRDDDIFKSYIDC